MAIRMRSAIIICFILSTVLMTYQLRNSLHLLFDNLTSTSAEKEGYNEVEMNNPDGEDAAVESDVEKFKQKPSDKEFPFGEKFPPIKRAEFSDKAVSKKAGKQKVLPNVGTIKKTVSSSLVSGLKRYADSEKRIILIVVDYGYLDFALNFKESSLDRLNITNFLLICADRRSHSELNLNGISCCYFEYGSSKSSGPSDFGTSDYYEKSNAKTAVMVQALSLGYSVLMVDADVVLFRNPFPYFPCSDCDIHVQMDRDMYNSGFVFVRPTFATVVLYETAWTLYVRYRKAHDQAYFNMAAKTLEQQNRLPRIHSLSAKLFQCGVYYFEHGNRMFENAPKCDECVMAHNNYLGSYAAKLYRFKENLLWMVDRDGYYSDTSRRYITYGNPEDFGTETVRMEVAALKNAIAVAVLLNRTVILPTFRCCSCSAQIECSHPMHRCSLLSLLKLKLFDTAFKGLYREHSFLNHMKVPLSVKNSLGPCLAINSSSSSPVYNVSRNCRVFQPVDIQNGATVEELEVWFAPYQNISVLRFHSMYGVMSTKKLEEDGRLKKLLSDTEDTFKCSEYEQWDESVLKF